MTAAQDSINSTSPSLDKNDPREIFGWKMYDWANSAFYTTVVGALGDYSNLKKRMMALFCYTAVIANALLFFISGNLYLLGGLLFIIANVCFGASMVFYNAFLPEITTEDQRDKVSSRGFAYGYFGGGLLLALNLILVLGAERLGISAGMAVRLSFLSAALWWGGFAIITFRRLKTREAAKQ